jgi:hypothetical protein
MSKNENRLSATANRLAAKKPRQDSIRHCTVLTVDKQSGQASQQGGSLDEVR